MAQTELLKIAHNVQECVKGVDDQVQDVTTKVQVVEDKVDVVIDGTQILFIWSSSVLSSCIARWKGREGCRATDGEKSRRDGAFVIS